MEPASDQAQQRAALARSISTPDFTLSVVGGVFNHAALTEDRACLNTLAWTGHRQTQEEEDFRQKICAPKQMFELEQDDFTHRSGLGLLSHRPHLHQLRCEPAAGPYGLVRGPAVAAYVGLGPPTTPVSRQTSTTTQR